MNIDLHAVAMSVSGQGRYAKALRIDGAVLEISEKNGLAMDLDEAVAYALDSEKD